MKMYSNDSVTKDYVDSAVREAVTSGQRNVVDQVSDLDRKQDKRIKRLELLLAISFLANAVLAIGAYF